ncbi:MAG TPA: glycerol-3-phosphate dehydrogenase, partial [Rhabdaerophilum sp.]|nr:glycerol-3-phosphate dehydrogenase [Rhabdaerophilum sp.]
MGEMFDLAILGGGINGCGIARDAAGRGLKVYLCEQDDLASGTSSWSTKLIHGGLRYLEYYEFRLVREALIEREVLWGIAPHIIAPLRFVLPHHRGLRPAWLLRLGLFLYDHLGGRKRLEGTCTLDLASHPAGRPLKPGFGTAFEYSDCQVQDSRLVVLNAMDARARGATIETRTRMMEARREDSHWAVTVEDAHGRRTVRAKALVNAGGPWVAEVLDGRIHVESHARVRLVKGSHIVTRKVFDHDKAYIFQNADGRIIFAIPYERDFTLIGTTDLDYSGDPKAVSASEEEIVYLCAAASEYFARPVTREDVVWSFSGVRPLYDDGASKAQEATRDYVLTLDASDGKPPLLSVFGGKITTYRRLAEAALAKLSPHLLMQGQPAGWTGRSALPGGDFAVDGLLALVEEILARYPFLEPETAARYARTYGRATFNWLGFAKDERDLGEAFGAGLSAREIRYLVEHEWARSGEDVLWRRTKLGLHLTPAQRGRVAEFVAGEIGKT